MSRETEKVTSPFECKEAAAVKNGGPTFLVPDCDSRFELAAFAAELEGAIAKKPQKIVLNFVGMMSMGSDAVLLLHDVLSQRSPETRLVVNARSPIQGSEVLLWLAGDERHIRPTAWLRFDINKPKRRGRFPWDQDLNEWWQEDSSEEGRETISPDKQTILRLVSRYIPVRQLSGCVLTPHILGEYNLLNNHDGDIS
jgi:hypothetical protein